MNEKSYSLSKFGLAVLPVFALCGGGPVFSQVAAPATEGSASSDTGRQADSSQGAGIVGVQEIVVTAQRRAEKLNDVGISVVATSGDDMKAKGVSDIEGLTKIVPGLTAAPTPYGNTVLTLRGIGFYESSLGASSPVATYVDEVPIPYTRMATGASLDLQRVEVLKGPQGTLYGQNTTGGTINYIANKPTPDFTAGADFSLGRFMDTDAQGYVSGPISDSLRFRVAVRTRQSDGWQESISRDATMGATHLLVGRVLLDWDASQRLKFAFSFNGFVDKSQNPALAATAFHPAVPAFATPAELAAPLTPAGNDRLADWDPDKNFDRNNRYYQLGLKTTYSVSDAIDLISITSYQEFHPHSLVDSDGTSAEVIGTGQSGFIKSFAQELRLQGRSGPIKYVVGGNFSDDDVNDSVLLYIGDSSIARVFGPSLAWDRLTFFTDQKPKTYAVFGNADYEIFSGLTVQGGVRYTEQDRSFEGCLLDAGAGPGFNTLGQTISIVYAGVPGTPVPTGGCTTYDPINNRVGMVTNKLDEDNVSWRTALNYKPNADSLFYASVSRGYKQGSFGNVGASLSTQYTPAKQESVLAYETGAKLSLFDRKLQVNGAIYYYDYSDKQLRGKFIDPNYHAAFEKLFNIPKSRVYGTELQVTAAPMRGLNLQGQVTYANSKILSHFDNLSPVGDPVDFHGESFELTPEWSANASAEYAWSFTSTVDAFVGTDLNYEGRQHGGYGYNPLFAIAPYALLDARAGIRSPDGKWHAQLWVRNLTNKYYWTNANFLSEFAYRQTGMPRTYGISTGFKF